MARLLTSSPAPLPNMMPMPASATAIATQVNQRRRSPMKAMPTSAVISGDTLISRKVLAVLVSDMAMMKQ